jgi:biopolymer transport protein ExbD
MRYLTSLRLSLSSILAMSVFIPAPSMSAEPPRAVWITVAEGQYCLVEEAKTPCADVLKHLREVLRVPAGTHLHVRAEKAATYETISAVFSLLQKTEYVTKMGYVNFSESAEH